MRYKVHIEITRTKRNTHTNTDGHTHRQRRKRKRRRRKNRRRRRRRKIVAGGRDGTDIEGSTSGHRGPKNREGKGRKHLENISKKRNRRTMLEKEKVEKIDSSKK